MLRYPANSVDLSKFISYLQKYEPDFETNNPEFDLSFFPTILTGPSNINNLTTSKYTFITGKWASRNSGIAINQFNGLIIAPLGFEIVSAQNVIRVRNPRIRFAQLSNKFFPPQQSLLRKVSNPDLSAYPGVHLSQEAYIGENVEIGLGSVVEPNAVIHSGTIIGKNSKISSGAIIGGIGFGYIKEGDETIPFPHYGNVKIGDRVDIGSNVCIDRGSLQDTVIGSDVKIDNLVHLAHNVTVGNRSFIIAGSVLCGSSVIGSDCWIAPNSVIGEGVVVGNNATIGFSTVVKRDVPANSVANGSPLKIYSK